VNAALLAAAILALSRTDVRDALDRYRAEQTRRVLDAPDPSPSQSTG
jgi:5-(carboxyamino)imidazole ribonucleotide mutase